MKKLLLGMIMSVLAVAATFAQPVNDNAVIPIGVTLNQILRLEVTNGGNMEFTFNSLNDYTAGLGYSIAASETYLTKYAVASSTRWALSIVADRTTMTNETGAGTLALGNIAYTNTATNTIVNSTFLPLEGDYAELSDVSSDLVTDDASTGNFGTATGEIGWDCATPANTTSTISLEPSGRYVVNVLLQLRAL
jgi:hypothetical protein